MSILPPDAWRLLALSACAAVLLLEHLRYALHARPDGGRRMLLALLVPGVGAVRAWEAGRRVAPVAYAVLAVAYVALWFWP